MAGCSAPAEADPQRPATGPATPLTAVQAEPSAPPPVAPPTGGDGTFAVAPGDGPVVGAGRVRIRYRVEVENGIGWGGNVVWNPPDFAAQVDRIIAAPQGWTVSADVPVTDPAVRLRAASWAFQRVAGTAYEVQIRLATPATVQRLCAQNGLDVESVYSCRFGRTLMINLGRWLNGADGYPVTLPDYRAAVINHELGHFLGFDHMGCPGPGPPAPVMQTQTIGLDGCVPNVHPFTADGRFVTGPWRAS